MFGIRARVVTALAIASIALGSATPASAALDKCEKAISGVQQKLATSIEKALSKCADGYQAAVVKGKSIADVAAKCQGSLSKAVDFANSASAMGKSKLKLSDLITKQTCTDLDLQALGHLPQSTFGDRWQRLVLIGAFDSAYSTNLKSVGPLVNIMRALSDAGGCPLCDLVSNPPCFSHACILDNTSGGEVHTTGSPITFGLSGAISIGLCNVPSIFPSGEYAVLGTPAKGFDTVTVIPGTAYACVRAFRTEGYIACGGTAPKVNYTICQDHMVTDLGGGLFADECETTPPPAGQFCAADTADAVHSGVINGGPCLQVTTAPAAPGDAFFLATTEIQVVLASELGPDGIACTDDDTPATPATPNALPQTTGSASALVKDANNTAGVTINGGPLTGAPFNCAQATTSNTSGGKTVSVLPALHGLLGNDLTTQNTLSCQ